MSDYSGQGGGGNYGAAPRMYATPGESDIYRPGGNAGDSKLYAHSGIEAVLYAASSASKIQSQSMIETIPHYVPSSAKGAYLSLHTPHEYFTTDPFLKPGSTARFVGDALEIQEDIKQAFMATTGDIMPEDIVITVLNDTEFAKAHIAHDGATSEGVQGFSINTNGKGINKVFVRANPLDKLMLTIGHEIGHVLTQSLSNPHDEEAKAFAFSIAWMNAVKDQNIAGIGNNILPEPAHNGLHDKAFAFVQWVIDNGTRAWDAFLQLARGEITINNKLPIVEVQ